MLLSLVFPDFEGVSLAWLWDARPHLLVAVAIALHVEASSTEATLVRVVLPQVACIGKPSVSHGAHMRHF